MCICDTVCVCVLALCMFFCVLCGVNVKANIDFHCEHPFSSQPVVVFLWPVCVRFRLALALVMFTQVLLSAFRRRHPPHSHPTPPQFWHRHEARRICGSYTYMATYTTVFERNYMGRLVCAFNHFLNCPKTVCSGHVSRWMDSSVVHVCSMSANFCGLYL